MLHSILQEIRKTQQWPQGFKISVFIPIPQKGKAKEFSDYLPPENSVCKSRINRTNMEQPDGQEKVRNNLTLMLGKTEGRRRRG